MKTDELILKKREQQELTKEEIDFLIQGYTRGNIPDYQISAFMMAAFLNGMTKQETANLTESMVNSGERLDLSSIPGQKVDKHSTGGVGDKTTLVLAPLVASAGLKVAKMSGRGLGHTGGTIDKLESFDGLNTQLTMEEFLKQVKESNLSIIGQTKQLAPADGKLYALRDVTSTVDSIPLIASSIMSKKLAAMTDVIVLDVKVGTGAFMQTLDEAIELAHEMVDIGKNLDRKTVALISDMNQPLGRKIGNALEVEEAIDTLKGQGPEELRELCLALGANLLLAAGMVSDLEEGIQVLKDKISSGEALAKLSEFVTTQNGDTSGIEDTKNLVKADNIIDITAKSNGYITGLDAHRIGSACVSLGAGRKTKSDKIDLSVGIELFKKTGEEVQSGDVLAQIHYNDDKELKEVIEAVKEAYQIDMDLSSSPQLIYGMISDETPKGELESVIKK